VEEDARDAVVKVRTNMCKTNLELKTNNTKMCLKVPLIILETQSLVLPVNNLLDPCKLNLEARDAPREEDTGDKFSALL
jgi:hypothetical protein